jgi:hypothetical protein
MFKLGHIVLSVQDDSLMNLLALIPRASVTSPAVSLKTFLPACCASMTNDPNLVMLEQRPIRLDMQPEQI